MTPTEAIAAKRLQYARVPKAPPQTQPRKTSYAEYLASPEWKAKTNLVHSRAKHVCEGCGVRQSKEVHHLTYKHVGHEFLFELVALCETCHERWHTPSVENSR